MFYKGKLRGKLKDGRATCLRIATRQRREIKRSAKGMLKLKLKLIKAKAENTVVSHPERRGEHAGNFLGGCWESFEKATLLGSVL